MEIEYGAEVVDRDGELLGKVDYVMRNAWTGEISKFVVRRERRDHDLFISPGDAKDATSSRIVLTVSSEDLGVRHEEYTGE